MRHVKLTVCEWEEIGELGFVPNIFSRWNSYNPTQGNALAHDLMEHSTKETGEIYQELKALGAYLYVRDFTRNIPDFWSREGGLLGKLNRVGENISSDLVNIYRDIDEYAGDSSIPEIAPRRFSKGIEDLLRPIFIKFRNTAVNIWRGENDVEEGDEFDDCPYADKLDLIEAWIREGYYLARKRYKGEYVYHVFEAITRESNKFFQNNEVFEGEVVTLSYNLDGHCRITRNERNYW